MDVGVDVNRARYWVERADKQFPHHPIVFQLKEKLLTVDKSNNDGEDLKSLIACKFKILFNCFHSTRSDTYVYYNPSY